MDWNYPLAEKVDFSYECVGRVLQDPYSWMEENNEKTKGYVEQQNAFTTSWFAARADVDQRANDLARKAGKPGYSNVLEAHDQLYATRRLPSGEMSAVILDQDFNLLSVLMDEEKSKGEFQVYNVQANPADPDIVALYVLKNGAARPSVLIMSVLSGEIIAEFDGLFSFVWAPDGKKLYYSDAYADADAGVNHNTVRAYDLDSKSSSLLYTEKDSAVFIMLEVSGNGDIFVHVNLSYVNIRVVHIDPETAAVTRMTTHDGSVFHYVGNIGAQHYFYTDEQAPKGKLIALSGSLSLADAVPVLPEEERILSGVLAAEGRLYVVYLNNAASEMSLYDQDGKKISDVNLPDKFGTVELSAEYPPNLSAEAQALYLNYESFICPPSVIRFDFESGQMSVVYSERDSGVREDIEVRSHPVTARDGTIIRAFLIRKKGTEANGQVPALMYGYGGYNSSLTPGYTAPFMGLDLVDWADRGGLFVHCILRGGGEYGAEWHQAAWRGQKKNAFHDFIDIAEWLIDCGWTNPEKLAINGGSNGGLLVTASMTMRPDLFAAVIASVPHTDMIRFARDDRGPMYITEYGDPRDPEMFDYMYSYSPYHNIYEGVEYPAVYVQTGEFDNNVPPYHGKKFAAKLQSQGGKSPCLLRVLARGSHGLGTGDDYYQTSAEMQFFAEYALGMQA
ncbi:MAG: prolyl oligopeptidase family serine peptidase [Eubacteriales bacterium]|nr:prolyl oligopeptidase family serine peptidase [Eubacteriales bacterium]